MSTKKPVHGSNTYDLIRKKPETSNPVAPPLAEEELDRVVGGYIGETEKNLKR
jgi:hypothetical protein